MNILREFSETPWWQEVRLKVISTLGLTSLATTSQALSIKLTDDQDNLLFVLDVLIKLGTFLSILVSIVVGITVIIKFTCWFKERKNGNSNNHSSSN